MGIRKTKRKIKAATDQAIYNAKVRYFSAPRLWQRLPDGDFIYTPLKMNWQDRRALFNGKYEADEVAIMDRFQKVDVIIEAGANIGFVARHAMARLNPGGIYIAVEPNPAS
jgi:hypothetical protein